MTTGHHEIDRVLLQQDEILPSSGFLASVMGSVQREATTPPPIPFPWRRALPGLLLVALALAVVAFAGVTAMGHFSRLSLPLSSLQPMLQPISKLVPVGTLAWTSLALLLAFTSIMLSLRLAAGRT